MVEVAVVPGWTSLAGDFQRSTGRTLELDLEEGAEGWLGARVSVDHVFVGSFGTLYPAGHVERLAQLANDLCANFLDELVGSGWPTCPDHQTHPLQATVSTSHDAVWTCPAGRDVARIGELSI